MHILVHSRWMSCPRGDELVLRWHCNFPMELNSLGDCKDRCNCPPCHYSAARYEHSLRKHILKLATAQIMIVLGWEIKHLGVATYLDLYPYGNAWLVVLNIQ